jgi:hypothetical protein
VRIGIQVLDADGKLLNRDHQRHSLPQPMPHSATVTVTVPCAAPAAPGRYRLKIDLVKEGVTWFEPTGSPAAVHVLQVI